MEWLCLGLFLYMWHLNIEHARELNTAWAEVERRQALLEKSEREQLRLAREVNIFRRGGAV